MYKIAAKAIANRLMTVIHKLVATDQTGSIRGRFIGTNIRVIDDLIDYCHKFHKPGLILLIDFEKAFDTVNWKFLQKTLKAFNFGSLFCKWIDILYKKHKQLRT